MRCKQRAGRSLVDLNVGATFTVSCATEVRLKVDKKRHEEKGCLLMDSWHHK